MRDRPHEVRRTVGTIFQCADPHAALLVRLAGETDRSHGGHRRDIEIALYAGKAFFFRRPRCCDQPLKFDLRPPVKPASDALESRPVEQANVATSNLNKSA